jgi:hypothetical protein
VGFGFPPRVLALVHPAHPESLCILLPSWHASFGSPLLHMTLRHFQLLLSHLAVSKTAILVSPVMHRTSPCRTCERFPLAKKSTIDMRFSAGFRFSLDLPTAIAEFSSPVSVRFKPATPVYTADRSSCTADVKGRPQDAEEATLFRLLGAVTQRLAASLNAPWREPALTIYSVRRSGPPSALLLCPAHECFKIE